MTYRLVIRPEAEADLAEGRDWYEARLQGLGGDFLGAVDATLDRIRQTPEMHAPSYKAVRRARLHRFPYIVYYRLVGPAVEVIAVLHGSRSPRRWRSRA